MLKSGCLIQWTIKTFGEYRIDIFIDPSNTFPEQNNSINGMIHFEVYNGDTCELLEAFDTYEEAEQFLHDWYI